MHNLDLFANLEPPFPNDRTDRARVKPGTGSRTSDRADYGPRGLLVRDPFATQLLDGSKTWEIRGRATQIRGRIVIIKSGTGLAFGTVNLVRVLGPLTIDDLINTPQLKEEEKQEYKENGLPYRKTYAYECLDPKWFRTPIPYSHPNGAVTWVRLPEMNLTDVQYASPSPERIQSIMA